MINRRHRTKVAFRAPDEKQTRREKERENSASRWPTLTPIPAIGPARLARISRFGGIALAQKRLDHP